MTCFWDGIIKAFNPIDFHKALGINRKPSSKELVMLLKKYNKPTTDIGCNGIKLTKKQLKENMAWIKELDENNIRSGYFCSGCDPFLLLVAQLFGINIIHQYNGHNIYYNNRATKVSKVNTKVFGSNSRHFWFVK